MSQSYQCCYCTKYVGKKNNTREHIIPVSWGGSDNRKNKRNCCHTCNTFRSNKPLDVWKAEIECLIAMGLGYQNHNIEFLKIIVSNIPEIQKAIDNATPDMYGCRKIQTYTKKQNKKWKRQR